MDKLLPFLPSYFDRKKGLPIVSAVVLYVSYKLLTLCTAKKLQGKEIPVPGSSYPYVGHMFSLGKLPGKTVSRWHAELGPIIKLNMGVKTWIVVDDAELAHKIFVVNGAKTSYRPYTVYSHNYHSIEGKGIAFAQPSKKWKKTRSAVLAVLSAKKIETYMSSIESEAQVFVSQLIKESSKNDGVLPFEHIKLFAVNIMLQIGFGTRLRSIEDPEFIKFSSLIKITMKNLGVDRDLTNFLPMLSWFDYLMGTEIQMKKFIKDFRDPHFLKYVKEASKSDQPNIIKSLEQTGAAETDEEKIVFMSDMITAGTDTVAVTIIWNFLIMCRYPDIQKKVSAEIDEFIEKNKRLPHFSERTQLPYCIATIKECLRYKPTAVFGIPHTILEDLEVDGYVLPKDCHIISSMDSMHKKSFPDFEIFSPERYKDNLKTMQSSMNGKIEDRDQYNFGWGRRSCPGAYLAEVELFHVFVQMFARCSIEPTAKDGMPDIDGAVNAGLTLLPLPCMLKFVSRPGSLF